MTKIKKNIVARLLKASQRPGRKAHRLATSLLFSIVVVGAHAAENPNLEETDGATTLQAKRSAALEFIRQSNANKETAILAELSKDLSPLESKWGIKLLGLRLTAAGYVIDFRYKVLDADKAAPLLNRSFNLVPYVLVEKSGAKLGVPFTEKAGSLRSSVTSSDQIKEGRNYSALFANPGQHVLSGDTVTIAIGDFRAEHVAVQ